MLTLVHEFKINILCRLDGIELAFENNLIRWRRLTEYLHIFGGSWVAKEVDWLNDKHLELSAFSFLDRNKISKWLLAVHHWCVYKFKSRQHCDALSFPLSITRQHKLEGELQSWHEVNGFIPAALQILDVVVSKVWCPIAWGAYQQWSVGLFSGRRQKLFLGQEVGHFDTSEIASQNIWWDSLHFRTE